MKYVVTIVSVFIEVLIVIYGWNLVVKDKSNTEFSKIDKEDESIYVDEQINQMIKSNEFKNATIDIKKEIARELLDQLKREGFISHYKFQKSSRMFSFTYSDGTQGGVLLEDQHPYFNG